MNQKTIKTFVKKMKLSDYIAFRLANEGVKSVFAVSGGASLHLIHSVDSNQEINLFCPHHEQSAAMAADGYSRSSGKFGVAIATSGPGATNLITGIACSFYDSVPTLFITGQVSTFRMVGNTGVRQIGFQETPIVEMCKPITKYASTLKHPMQIKEELDKAIHFMHSGRPGPVLIDIPDNFQRELIDISEIRGWEPSTNIDFHDASVETISIPVIEEIYERLSNSHRPVIIAGWGIHLSNNTERFVKFIEELNVPVATTWGASDILEHGHPLFLGNFGTHGVRHANFAVQNSDFILSLGSRLDTKSTGTPINSFARNAYKIVLDIDPSELRKFESFDLKIDKKILGDLTEFFNTSSNISIRRNTFNWWKTKIKDWRRKFSDFDSQKDTVSKDLNPYDFFRGLGKIIPRGAKLFIDTGSTLAWAMQSYRTSKGQRIFHDFNNTAMGWALPASMGAWSYDKAEQIFCITGDGSLMMNLQELATISQHKIPLTIFIINNGGYSMIKQTQDQWFESKYVASQSSTDLFFPNFEKLAEAFEFSFLRLKTSDFLDEGLVNHLKVKGPKIIEVVVKESHRVIPQVKAGRPNEDMEPLLPRPIFERNMLIKPLPYSETL